MAVSRQIRMMMRSRALVLAGLAAILVAGATFVLANAFAAGKETKPAADASGKSEALWTVRCQEEDKTREHCEVFQRLIVKETGARVAEFAIGFPEDKALARGEG